MGHDEIERLAARVRACAHGDGLVETAQVKLLGLDDVRAAAGPRWPRMREHVREGSLKIIAQRIDRDDAVIPCGDGFLVVFANASPEQSQARCAEIREALLAFYLGEQALTPVRADVERETVSARHLAALVAEDRPRPHVAQQRNDLKLGRFWPLWSARHHAVAAYICAPSIVGADGLRFGYSPGFLELGAHAERDHLDVDLCLLEQACAASETSEAPIGVTVHETTMRARKSRAIYLQHLTANASPAQRRMFITIAEIEPGSPLLSLTEWTRTLKRFFPRVALDLHHSDRALSGLSSTGAWGAGFHLPPVLSAASSKQLRTQLQELDAWCRTLRRQGLMPIINGFPSAAFLDLASYSDWSFASGERLWPSQSSPGPLAVATVRRSPGRDEAA